MSKKKQSKANRENTKRSRAKTSKKKALIKKDDSLKALTLQETKDFINKIAYMNDDPKRIMKKLSEDLLPQIRAGKSSKKVITEATETAHKALIVCGLDTHYPLAETVGKRYRPLVIEFSHQLTKEYDCRMPSEKALVQIIVNAYARILEYSQSLHTCREVDWLSNEKNGFYSMLSKELDRANRQFITALTTLKQIETPSFEVNVKTKAAFVAQNQQLNVNPPNKDNPNKNENIEPK